MRTYFIYGLINEERYKVVDKEPIGFKDRVRSFFGFESSAEIRRKEAETAQALAEVEALVAQMPKAIAEERKKREAALKADSEARKEEARRIIEEATEEILHRPNIIDRAHDTDAIMATHGRPDFAQVLNQATINHWVDKTNGNDIYLPGGTIDQRQVRDLSMKIAEQRVSFEQLSPEEQTRVRREFTSKRTSGADSGQYVDYLSNETLKDKFDSLKSKSPK